MFLLLMFIVGSSAGSISYECEKVIGGAGFSRSPWRSGASAKGTLDVYRGDKIQLTLCVKDDIIITIDNIFYSNDGENDTVRIWAGETVIGDFTSAPTYNGFGRYWNEFKTSGQLGSPIALPRGEHFVYIDVLSSDCYGVELDKIDITTNLPVAIDTLVCDAQLILAEVPTKCSAPLDVPLYATTKSTPVAVTDTTAKVITAISITTPATIETPTFIQQLSYKSGCLDTPNVKVKFNPTSLTNVNIYARNTENDKFEATLGANYSKGTCKRSIWQIGVADNGNSELGPPSTGTRVVHDVAAQTDTVFPASVDPSVTKDVRVTYVVPPDINIKRGAVYLTIGLVNVTEKTKVGIQYYGRARTDPSDVDYKSFTADLRVITWTLPARSVSPLLENQLHIYFNQAGGKKINIDFIRLDYTASDVTFKSKPVLQTPVFRVRGRQYKVLKKAKTPEGMSLTVDGKPAAGNYANVVLLTRQSPKGRYWKVLTVTDEGMIIPCHRNKKSFKINNAGEGVKFKDISGIVFGSDTKKVSNVEIDTRNKEIIVTYANGKYVKFTFNYSNQRTKFVVTESTLTDNYIQYQSTHVTDDMAAVNKLVIDNQRERYIMDDLANIKGERFTFTKTSPNRLYRNSKIELHFPPNVIPSK